MNSRILLIVVGVAAIVFVGGAAFVGTVGYMYWTKAKSNAANQANVAQATVSVMNKPDLNQPNITQFVAAENPKVDTGYETKLKPFINKYCNSCHNSEDMAAGVALDAYMNEAHARKDRKVWEQVADLIEDSQMPPKKAKLQPTKDERKVAIDYIRNVLTKVDCTSPKDPGRVTLRRLNRAEYNNTIRDLTGVSFQPADDFPNDDVGYGFDNIGDVLSLQPLLIEKYMSSADKILNECIPRLDRVPSSLEKYNAQPINVEPRDAKITDNNGNRRRIIFTSKAGNAYLDRKFFPASGEYRFIIRAWGTKLNGEAPKIELSVAGKKIKEFTVDTEYEKAQAFEVKTNVDTGEWKINVAFKNPYEDKTATDDKKKFRSLGIIAIEYEGPLGGADRPLPLTARRIITARPSSTLTPEAAAEKVISEFARRAFRRPVKPEEITKLMKLFAIAQKNGDNWDRSLMLPMKAILVSPHFLFRIEDDPKGDDKVRTINDFEFATRLSYFLWSTMPDEELYQAALAGNLRKPDVLRKQISRMLQDPKSKAITDNFAMQWLTLRNLATITPDKKAFPTWDDSLRNSMLGETENYFDYVVKNDRPITEFLDSNYTFVNERLAKHYGLSGVRGNDFRKVTLPDSNRGGLLTHASVLTVTSNPTRTSPVKRGKWILENIFNTPPPPPAPNVPELEATPLKGTLRQQMEQHRANPSCATCHNKLDPLGFGLENFDAIGVWRTDDKKVKIDSSGVLPDGSKFDGPAGLRKVLLTKSDQFRRCLAEKLLTFSLGRGLEYYDKCVIDELTVKLKSGGDKFSSLVIAIAESDAFHKRQAKRNE